MPGATAAGSASAFIATAFAQEDAEAAKAQWRKVADQLRPKLPKLAAFMAIERLFRDAHAGAIMAPTADALRDFIGKAVLGMEVWRENAAPPAARIAAEVTLIAVSPAAALVSRYSA